MCEYEYDVVYTLYNSRQLLVLFALGVLSMSSTRRRIHGAPRPIDHSPLHLLLFTSNNADQQRHWARVPSKISSAISAGTGCRRNARISALQEYLNLFGCKIGCASIDIGWVASLEAGLRHWQNVVTVVVA